MSNSQLSLVDSHAAGLTHRGPTRGAFGAIALVLISTALGACGTGGGGSGGSTGGASGSDAAAGGTVADSGGSGGVVADAAVVTPDAAVVTPDAAIVPPDAALPVSTATGQPCAVAADCGDGFDCNTEVRGGYCMPGSPGGPTACRPPDVTCPDQTHCSPLPWHQISGVCLLACDSPSDCREGYDCQVVSLFPGDPSSPTSDGTVCWVRQVCQPGMDQTCNDNPALNSIHGVCRFDGTCECNAGFALNPDTGRCL